MAGRASGILQLILGAGVIAASIFVPGLGALIIVGAGTVLSGLGTIISGSGTGRQSAAAASRNPIKSWDVVYGEGRLGGTLIYINWWPPPAGYSPTGPWWSPLGLLPQGFAAANSYLDLVFVVAAHQIQGIEAILFEGTPIAIDPTAHLYPTGGPGNPHPTIGGTSYTPTQTNKQTTSISRLHGVVTVVCPFDIPALDVGYPVILQDEFGADGLTSNNLAGTFIVEQIVSRSPGVSLTFTVLSGGKDATVPSSLYPAAGYVTTGWPNYGRNVFAEYLLGDQILGQTFNGLISGTPQQGTGSPVNPDYSTANNGIPAYGTNPWTTYCSLQGKAAVFIRLYYQQQYFSAGIPQISFILAGKQDIYDPRLGALSGLKTVTLYSPGAGGYAFSDVLTVAGGNGGQITITGIDGSGNPTSWVTTNTGYAYSLTPAGSHVATSGGKGSGAEVVVTVLGGISCGVASVAIETGGQNYNKYDILQVGGPVPVYAPTSFNLTYNGSQCFLKVESVSSSGAVLSVIILQGGYGYTPAVNLPTTVTGSVAPAFPYYTPGSSAVGGGTGCTITVLTVTNSASPSTVGSSAVYSTNSALAIADYLADPIWGYNAQYVEESATPAPYNAIGIAALTIAANVCDQQVELAVSIYSSPPLYQTEAMYACNGHFDLSLRRGDVLQNLLTSCAGRLLYLEGVYSIQPGYWAPAGFPSGNPVVPAIAAVDIDFSKIAAGNPTWKPNVKIRDLFNAVKGTYICPSNKYEQSDFPSYAQDSLHGYSGPSQYGGDINLAVDLGQRRFKDIHLPFTISDSMAQRIAKIELLRGRNQGGYGIGTGIFPCNMAGYQFVPLDVANATFPFLGWTGYSKILEVTNVDFRCEVKGNAAPTLGTEISVQETSEDIYLWSPYEELSPEGLQQAVSPASTLSETVPFPWSPGAVVPLDGDAIFLDGTTDEGNFGMLPTYGADAQGNATANLALSGLPPFNQLDTELAAPFVSAYASPSGGSLAPGTYVVGISAFDAAGNNLPYQDLATVVVGGGQGAATATVDNPGQNYAPGQSVQVLGGDNNCILVIGATTSNGLVVSFSSISNAGTGYTATSGYATRGGSGTGLTVSIGSLTGATATGSIGVFPIWGPGNDGGDLYMARQTVNPAQLTALRAAGQTIAKNVMHYQQTLSAGQASATVTTFTQSTAGGPDALFYNFNVLRQQVIHSGPWAQQVQAVTGTSGTSPGTVTIAGSGMSLNQWAGYTLTLLGYYAPGVGIPILNMPITASTASAGGGGATGPVASLTLVNGGVNYAYRDQIFIDETPITGAAAIQVDSVGAGGSIATWHIVSHGNGYHNQSNVPSEVIDFTSSGSGALWDVTIAAPETFTLTIGRNADGGQLPALTSLLNVGDLVGVLNNWTFTASSLTDANIANGYYPSGDLDVEAGHVAVVMTGVDAGDVQPIAYISNSLGPISPSNPATTSNPAITFNIGGTWQQTPNTGDMVVICDATLVGQTTKTFQTPNKSGGVVTVANLNVQNLLSQVWLFTVQTLTQSGATAPDYTCPRRMLYFFGAQATRAIGYIAGSPPVDTYTMQNWDGLIQVDCSGGDVTYNCLPFAQVVNQQLIFTKIDNSGNTFTINCAAANSFADGTTSWSTSSPGGTALVKIHDNLPLASIASVYPPTGGSSVIGFNTIAPWVATIAPNWESGQKQKVTATGDTAFVVGSNFPSGTGNNLMIFFTQDSVGGHAATFDSSYGTNIPPPDQLPNSTTVYWFTQETGGSALTLVSAWHL